MASKNADTQDDKSKKQEELQVAQTEAVADNSLTTGVDNSAQPKENGSKSKSSKDDKDAGKHDVSSLSQTEENVTKPNIPKAEEVAGTPNIVNPFDVEVDKKRVDGRIVEDKDKDKDKVKSPEDSKKESVLQSVSAGDSSHGIAPSVSGQPTVEQVNKGDVLDTSQPVYEYVKVDAEGKQETIQTNAVQSRSPTDVNPEDLNNPSVMHKVGVAEAKAEVPEPLEISKADEKKIDEKVKDDSEDLTASERTSDATLKASNNIHEGVAYDQGHSIAPSEPSAVSTEETEKQQEKNLKEAKKVNQMLSDPYGKHN